VSTSTDSELLAVVASKVDDLRTDVGELSVAVKAIGETKSDVQSMKVQLEHLTKRVVDLEDAQRWLARTAGAALIAAVLAGALALPV
jgi:hypothetical protein